MLVNPDGTISAAPGSDIPSSPQVRSLNIRQVSRQINRRNLKTPDTMRNENIGSLNERESEDS